MTPSTSSLVAEVPMWFADVSIDTWCNLAYLVASVLLILGLIGLANPNRAVRGNMLAAMGMAIAIGVTLWKLHSYDRMPMFNAVLGGLAAGAVVGGLLAIRAKLIATTQIVALLNGFGGLAATLVAGAIIATTLRPSLHVSIAAALAGLLGSATFAGGMLAYVKLGKFRLADKLAAIPGKLALTLLSGLTAVALYGWLVSETQTRAHPEQYDFLYPILCVVAALFGIGLVLPIRIAHMPAAVARLNGVSGFAAAACGFAMGHSVLIVAGALVGSAGIAFARFPRNNVGWVER